MNYSTRYTIHECYRPGSQVGDLQALGARIETRFPGVRETLINAWAALLAGLAAYTVATPIEAIKVGLQTWPGSNLPSVIGKIVKVKGFGGFFYGLDAMYAAGLPYSLVMYSVYQPIKKMTNTFLGDNNSAFGAIVGASFAELIGLLVFLPGELVRNSTPPPPTCRSLFCLGRVFLFLFCMETHSSQLSRFARA